MSPVPPAALGGHALAYQALIIGILAAQGVLASLAYRPLGEPLLKQVGLFLLASAAAGATYSGATEVFRPEHLTGWLDPISLVLGAATFGLWGGLSATILSDSSSARRLAPGQRSVASVALFLAILAMIPNESIHLIAEGSLGILTPTLAAMTLLAALRARGEGNQDATALALGSMALLVCSGTLWALHMDWVARAPGMGVLYTAMGAQGILLGGTILDRMGRLRRERDQALADQLTLAEGQKAELEALLEVRNRELMLRLQELETASTTDSLTGACNRRRFEEAVAAQLALAQRGSEPLSLIVMDLDHFKRINDTYGHAMGDEVLVGTAATIRQNLRVSDLLVRWGGEEFLVLAPGTALEGAMALAEKLRSALAAEAFPQVGQVTMSLGVAQCVLGEDLKAWIDRADQALYEAKDRGRNQCVAAAPHRSRADAGEPAPAITAGGWGPEYECGHPLMDNQHQRLHLLATAALTLLSQRASAAEILASLESLVAIAAQHFQDEEALLRDLKHPQWEAHSAEHQGLLHKARYILNEAAAGRVEVAALVQYLVRDLVEQHIDSDQQNYFGDRPGRSVAG